jgi:hypothetical protein
LSFGGDTCQLHDFVKYNCAGDLDRRRLIIGYVFKIYGVLVNCQSMLQATLVLSTTKVHPDENLAELWGIFSKYHSIFVQYLNISNYEQGEELWGIFSKS